LFLFFTQEDKEKNTKKYYFRIRKKKKKTKKERERERERERGTFVATPTNVASIIVLLFFILLSKSMESK
jgi:hypothetical protein